MMLGNIALRYIFFELVPSFLMGNFIFVFIMLMFQGLKFTEFVLVQGVSLATLGEILGFMTISVLPAILPMSILFSVLLTYGRLSGDSEIVALKSSGHSMITIAFPALILGLLTMTISAQTSFNLAPWGNRQFEVLISKILSAKSAITLKEGTFMEGFFDMVVYANKVHPESGVMEQVFIYDERQNPPVTIIARAGELKQNTNINGQKAELHLYEGDIHRKNSSHTKINFGKFDIKLANSTNLQEREKSLQSLTLDEIRSQLSNSKLEPEQRIKIETEFYKRWNISYICLVFSILGVGLGTSTNRRTAKGGGIAQCIVLVVVYWILYVAAESSARAGTIPVPIALCLPSALFTLAALWSFKRRWN
jgi:lipopolysaccharide export system permease protein